MELAPTLAGRLVRLEPLGREHVAALAVAASGDRSTFGLTTVPDGGDEMRRHVDGLVAGRQRGECVPFVQCAVAGGQVVGMTTFLDLVRWSGREDPDEVEIGGTWLTPTVQRTGINTEAKLLLLTFAFETWNVVRVAFKTDARNRRSRDAIQRIGAVFEGVQRNHPPSAVAGEEGRPRDSAVAAITVADWPWVRDELARRLHRGSPGGSFRGPRTD